MKIVHQRSYYRSKISSKRDSRMSPYRRHYRYSSSSSGGYSSLASKRRTTTRRYVQRSSSSYQRRSKKRKVSRFESVLSRKSRESKKTIRKKRRKRRRRSALEDEERGEGSGHQEDTLKTGSEVIPDQGNELTTAEEEVSQEVQYTYEMKAEDIVAMEKEVTELKVEESLEPVVVDRGDEDPSPIEI